MKLKDTGCTYQQIMDKTDKYMIGMSERYQFITESGKDMSIYDTEGNEYLDFFGGIAVNSAGNGNEKVIEAIINQTKEIIHTSNYPYSIPQAQLAELICETIGMDKIFFQNSGTEANEAMIKMARKYGIENYGPNRYHIVTAKHSFHGRTYGALSATGQPDNAIQQGYNPILPGFTYADFNDLESFKNACTEDTIAIMIEPVQGEGGVYPATQEFIKGLREFCDEKNMLLLFDEVQTGWGRTGDIMAFIGYGVKPDILTMAKAMGGGMPIGAICATNEAAKAFSAGAHGTTYGGNPVCCAASYAQISEILDKDLSSNAKTMGEYFMKELSNIPCIKEVRGRGLLVGVEFDGSVNANDVKHGCLDRKLLITAVSGDVIRMVPPLILTKEDCDKAVSIIKESVESLIK